ncbi:MAG: FAD:protein FMN transferase [Verrucomicrobiota bacterium]
MSRRQWIGRSVVPVLLPLAGCRDESLPLGEQNEEASVLLSTSHPAMGTDFTIRAWTEPSQQARLIACFNQVTERIDALHASFSDYRPDSELNALARAPVEKPLTVSPDLFAIFERAAALFEKTGGAFDITAGPITRLWRLAKKSGKLPDESMRERALERTGFHHLSLDPESSRITKHQSGMLFDLGGIAKGYGADAALALLSDEGFSQTLIAASGDIVAGESPPGAEGWRIGLETLDLSKETSDLPTLELQRAAVSTSGDSRQFVEIDGTRYSHIVSTKTGLGLTERIAATVLARDGMTSDSHATAVTLLGKNDGLQFIRNQRGIECRVAELIDGVEVFTSTDGFTDIQTPEKETPLAAP